jgi:methyl-accepting chemotaxis protein
MTSDTITELRVRTLACALEIAAESIERLAESIKSGDVTAEDAADEVNEAIDNLNRCAK